MASLEGRAQLASQVGLTNEIASRLSLLGTYCWTTALSPGKSRNRKLEIHMDGYGVNQDSEGAVLCEARATVWYYFVDDPRDYSRSQLNG